MSRASHDINAYHHYYKKGGKKATLIHAKQEHQTSIDNAWIGKNGSPKAT